MCGLQNTHCEWFFVDKFLGRQTSNFHCDVGVAKFCEVNASAEIKVAVNPPLVHDDPETPHIDLPGVLDILFVEQHFGRHIEGRPTPCFHLGAIGCQPGEPEVCYLGIQKDYLVC